MDDSEAYVWFCELHCVQYERPEGPGDEEWWEWQMFAADWARELLREGAPP
jgi:hypothetical protein